MSNNLVPLICTQCGAPIDRATLTCEHCGTQFEYNSDNIVVVRERLPHEKTLGARVSIRLEELSYIGEPSDRIGFAIRELSHNLADQLIPFIEFEQAVNPLYNAVDVYGRVRIIEPSSNLIDVLEAQRDRLTNNGKMLIPRKREE